MKLRAISSCHLLLLTLLAWPAFAAAGVAPDKKPEGVALGSPGFNELLAKQIQPGVLTTEALEDGSFKLNNPIQTLQAHVTASGTTFISTSKEKNKQGEFNLSLVQWGRENNLQASASSQIYRDGDNVFHAHDGLVEKFSNTGNGIQQDFIIPMKPDGDGALQVQLAVDGATLQTKNDGFTVALNNSQRVLTYDRLKVTDADGNNVSAHMQLKNNNRINIVVDDNVAQYPLTIDPTVGDANWVSMGVFSGATNDIRAIVSSESNIYIAGDFSSVGDTAAKYIAKWDGVTWSAVGDGMNNSVYALAVDNSGNLYAGGLFTMAGGIPVNHIAKWNGVVWDALDIGMNNVVEALVVDGSGNLYAGGHFITAGDVTVNCIAKWNGSTWSSLGTGMNAYVDALVIDADGNLYAGGGFTVAGDVTAKYIAKWNGNAWTTLGSGMNFTISTLAIDMSGNLYAGGDFTVAGGVANTKYIAGWNGVTWFPLGMGVNSNVEALAVDGSGNLYVGGIFDSAGGIAANGVARWDGNAWSVLDTGLKFNNSNSAGSAHALAFDSSGNLYVGGWFQRAGGVPVDSIAKWNGSVWYALGVGGLDGQVYALAVDNDGNTYVGGGFISVAGIVVNKIAKWNGSVWSALGSGMDRAVYALVVDSNNNLYAGGDFTSAGGVAANNIAKWDGTVWSALGGGTDCYPYGVRALAVDSSDNLYLGGGFSSVGGVANTASIAKWNGSVWSALGAGININNFVYALAIDNSDNIYVGGNFISAGGIVVNSIAKWNGGTWSALGTGMNMYSTVLALATDSGNNLYAGGGFTSAGGVPVNHIAKWNGSAWSALGSGVYGGVTALVIDREDNLYVGGSFTQVDSVGANKVAEWNGSVWSALGAGVNSFVFSLALDSNKNLYVGGDFTSSGGKISRYLAKWLFLDTDGDGVGDTQDCYPLDNIQSVCAAGTYPTGTGFAQAPAGSYAINGVLSQCAVGTYQPLTGQSSCITATVCTADQFESLAPTPISDRVCAASKPNDFDANGKADILLRNLSTGDWNLAQLNGLSVVNQGSINGAFTDVDNVIVSTADFNGDGSADILTRGTADGLIPGAFHIDLMSGQNVIDSNWLTTLSMDLNDEVMSTKDFNKDGKADVLLRNSVSGVWTINYMNGVNNPTIATLNATLDTCYILQGDGDYDGNGYPDLLLRKDHCGGGSYPWLVYTTNGTSTVLASGGIPGVATSANWGAVVTDKDFDGDGKSDLLIRFLTGTTQQWVLYNLNGVGAPSANGLVNIAVQNLWQFAAEGEFNADGKADLLLRNTGNGQWYIYLLNNTAVLSGAPPNVIINPLWILQGTDDYNGDGKSDLLIRNTSSGQWYMNLINGSAVQTKAPLTINSDLGYVLQND